MLGHNQPPLADRLALDHAELVKSATEAAALVPDQIRAIETDEEAAAYTDTAADIKAVIAEADAAFKAEKAPWLEGGRTVEAFFSFRGTLDAAVKRLRRALDDRAGALLAARRKAEQAAAEKARKEAEAFDEPAPVMAAAPVREVARVVSIATGNKASASIKWRGEVVDIDALPRQYMRANQDAIDAAIKGGVRAIPGVRIFEEVRTAIRR